MRKALFPLVAVLVAALMGCESASPNSPNQRAAMKADADVALEKMKAQDPNLNNLLQNSYGYAIFPEIGAAAAGIGGASGRGEVFKGGQMVGEVTMNQASIGPQIGGDSYGELLIFQNEQALNRLINNSVEFGADAQAQILKAGAGGSASFANGVAVYILPRGGLMAGANLNTQKFIFHAVQNPNPQ